MFNPLFRSIRSLRKHSRNYIVSIFGLGISLAISFLLAIYIQHESSWDSYNENSENLYILRQKLELSNDKFNELNQTPPALIDKIKLEYPEVGETCLIIETWGDYIESKHISQFYEEDGFYADNSIFSIFTYEFVKGNPETALIKPRSIVLSQNVADRLFPHGDALGRIVTISKDYNLIVTGIYKDLPDNMHVRPTYLCSFDLYDAKVIKNYRQSFYNYAFKAYTLIHNKSIVDNLNNKIKDIYKEVGIESKHQPYFRLVSEERNNTSSLTIYKVAAILLVLLSGLNYFNTISVTYFARSKEIGIKKVIGADRLLLAKQLIGELLVISSITIIIIWIASTFLIPMFNQWLGKSIVITFSAHWRLILLALLSAVLIIFLGGLVPTTALYSKISDIVRQGEIGLIKNRSTGKNIFVGFQFIICICFIVFSIVMQKQLQFVNNKDIGVNPENVIYAKPRYNGNKNWKPILKKSLSEINGVESVSLSNVIPFYGNSVEYVLHSNGIDKLAVSRNWIDSDYFKTFGIELVEGRNFLNKQGGQFNKCIVNERTIQMLGLEDPINQWIRVDGRNQLCQIIGVIKNHEHYSVKSQAPAMIYYFSPNYYSTNKISISLATGAGKNIIDKINETTQKVLPGLSFEFWSYSERVAKTRGTISLNNSIALFRLFTLIAIFISLLGLYGIISFNTQKRIKEIGIRKVNGAKIYEVLAMLNKDLVIWIAIAFLLACPIAYFAMSVWLENFAYKIDLSWWIFAISGLLALGISVITVSWQSWKAANRNPVEALRYE